MPLPTEPAQSAVPAPDAPDAAAASAAPGLRRALGPVDATCVVVGGIVGVGIFFTPAEVARIAGDVPTALAAWAVGGAVALLGALLFGQLGRRYPRGGAQYDILRDAWGAPVAFLFAFCSLTASQAGSVAIIAALFALNVSGAVGGDALGGLAGDLVAQGAIWALALANVAGVRWGARVQDLTVAAKVAALLGIVLLAALFGAASPSVPAAAAAGGGLGALLAALVPVLFSFGGWQHALWMAGEVRDPSRTLPRSIVGGVGLVVAIYLAAAWAYFVLLGYDGVAASDALAMDAVGAVLPGAGRRAAAAAVAVSAFGVLNAQFLAGPRLTWAMAADGRFFRPFAAVSPRTGTPVAAILLLAVLASAFLAVAGLGGVGALTAWVVVVDALFFALTGLALPRLAGATTAVGRGWLVVAVLFAALELGAVWGALNAPSVRGAALVGLGWIGAAGALYLARFRRRPATTAPAPR